MSDETIKIITSNFEATAEPVSGQKSIFAEGLEIPGYRYKTRDGGLYQIRLPNPTYFLVREGGLCTH